MKTCYFSKVAAKSWMLFALGLACLLGTLVLQAATAERKTVCIRNDDARRDTSGAIIDAHDGCLEYFGGKFYLYGTRYGATDGFALSNQFACYSSEDLVTWVPRGAIIKGLRPGVYYRPKVKFCSKTDKYVLWFNWYPKVCGLNGRYGVATADRPEGPFVIHEWQAHVKHFDSPGDFDLFVDEDGAGYIVYTTDTEGKHPPHFRVCIGKLSADYLSSTSETSQFLGTNVEAPAMFKREGIYYVLFDNTCCFCRNGSGARVYTSTAPLGPYTYRGNINRSWDKHTKQRSLRTEQGAGRFDTTIQAQQAQVATIPAADGQVHIWIGDRWRSAPDGIKGHDFQYWSPPLQFGEDGMIKPLQWHDSWSIELK